jgi:hypothetical protein
MPETPPAPQDRLPNGKRATAENVEKWFMPIALAIKKNASQELSKFLTLEGRGGEDGAYHGAYSYRMTVGGQGFVVYAQFINGACVQAVNIPDEDLELLARDYVIGPMMAADVLNNMGPRETVKPSIWVPGDDE